MKLCSKFQVKILKNVGENRRKDWSWSFRDWPFVEISLSQLVGNSQLLLYVIVILIVLGSAAYLSAKGPRRFMIKHTILCVVRDKTFSWYNLSAVMLIAEPIAILPQKCLEHTTIKTVAFRNTAHSAAFGMCKVFKVVVSNHLGIKFMPPSRLGIKA